MTTSELISWVKYQLGYPVVQLELSDETIKLSIGDALSEVIPWYTDTKFFTIPLSNSSCIDLSDYDINEIISIRPGESNNISDNLFSDMLAPNNFLSQLEIMVRNQYVGYVKDNLSYEFIDNKLYIDMYPKTSSITIEYIPNIHSVEDIEDVRLLHYVKQFTLEFTKKILSQVRGKFRIPNSPLELDVDNLRDSSQSELERLRLALRDEFIDNVICD